MRRNQEKRSRRRDLDDELHACLNCKKIKKRTIWNDWCNAGCFYNFLKRTGKYETQAQS